MHVIALLRLVPDTSEELEIDASGTAIDREWIGTKLCEFDDHALEEAILLKERAGATVTAVALAGEGVDRLLQTAIARGADRAVKVETDLEVQTDTPAVASVLSQALLALKPDVVLTGVLTPEDLLGQWAPYLAGKLGWPTVNAVSSVKTGAGTLEVRQEYSGGRSAQIEVQLPAILGIQSASQPPRYVSGTKLRQAMQAPIEGLPGPEQSEAAAARVTSLSVPERGAGAEMLEGGADDIARRIAAILSERSLSGH